MLGLRYGLRHAMLLGGFRPLGIVQGVLCLTPRTAWSEEGGPFVTCTVRTLNGALDSKALKAEASLREDAQVIEPTRSYKT